MSHAVEVYKRAQRATPKGGHGELQMIGARGGDRTRTDVIRGILSLLANQ